MCPGSGRYNKTTVPERRFLLSKVWNCFSKRPRACCKRDLQIQGRTSAARNQLADTQQRLKQAEAQKNSLEARNRILESFIFAQSRPTAGIPLAIACQEPEVCSNGVCVHSHACTSRLVDLVVPRRHLRHQAAKWIAACAGAGNPAVAKS